VTWTTTPPAEPGYYWAWAVGPQVRRPVVVLVERPAAPAGPWLVVGPGTGQVFRLQDFTHWLGPLPWPAPRP
jgi:hypothetical protein